MPILSVTLRMQAGVFSDSGFTRDSFKFKKRCQSVVRDISGSLSVVAVRVRCIEHATSRINLR
jgi:hypothetical protein